MRENWGVVRVENSMLVGEGDGNGDIVGDVCGGREGWWLDIRRQNSRNDGGINALFDVLAIPENDALGL